MRIRTGTAALTHRLKKGESRVGPQPKEASRDSPYMIVENPMRMKSAKRTAFVWFALLSGHIVAACTPTNTTPTQAVTETPELTPGEIIQQVPVRQVIWLYDEDLMLVGDCWWIADYIDESGPAPGRWDASLMVGTAKYPSARPRAMEIGDIIEFANYRIRVLAIAEYDITIAIQESTQNLSDLPGIYNAEVGEVIQHRSIGNEALPYDGSEPLIMRFDNPRLIEPVEEGIEEWEVTLWVGLNESPDLQSYQVRTGNIIEFEGYRIRILTLFEDKAVFVATGKLSELSAVVTSSQH